MAKTTTDIPQLIFNKVSKEKYEELKANGELVDNQFYITPENEVDISDKADTAYVDEQIDLKADKETTYTKEEVDNLLENIDALPEQTDNSGKLLSTDGENALWIDAPSTLPVMDDTVSGKYLTTDGTNASWGVVNVIADQHSGFSPKKIWTGTKEQYNQITTKSGLTLYYVHEDGIYLGDKLISDAGSDITTNGWNIFDHKFSDHLLNDPSWVRSDTFSWQDGGIYFTAYEELEKENSGRIEDIVSTETWYAYYHNSYDRTVYTTEETPQAGVSLMRISGDEESGWVFTEATSTFGYNEENKTLNFYDTVPGEGFAMPATYTYAPERNIVITSKTKGNTSTDTYGEISIDYYKSANGLKICLPDQSDAIEQLYANTGVAWYYIIDTENKRFKLPRKVSETLDLNTVAVVGNGMTLGLTTGSDTGGLTALTASGSLKGSWAPYGQPVGTATVSGQDINTNKSYGITTDPEKSGIIADLSTIGYKEVTEQTYLYFFMGDTLRDARIIDVNAVVENQTSVTNELDALKNLLANIDYVVESKVATDEDPTWYRVYKSGWVEQGGCIIDGAQVAEGFDINLPKEFANMNYTLIVCLNELASSWSPEANPRGIKQSTSVFHIQSGGTANPSDMSWEAKGQGAE